MIARKSKVDALLVVSRGAVRYTNSNCYFNGIFLGNGAVTQ